ncbi:MAG: TetR/AcrR family transcriptional regulator [Solobacterium sp.]|nr:TetR/AcrR family transcriptional regulator [Solobacterium sp.]MBR0479169.1 TetR/AcrR family transcriptional regulator [Solobacterium sp.]
MTYQIFENLPEEKQELILSTGIKAFSGNTYKDVSTDSITKQCGISKGLLFHYFGSKKDYYLYCLEKSMQRLIGGKENLTGDDFYGILFDSMNRKMETCMQYQDEMHMVNMASRDASVDVADGKAEILRRYRTVIQLRSAQTLQKAMARLELKDTGRRQITAEGLQLYINAVINKYLTQYQQTPDRFFENSKQIRQEIRMYLDLMLYGICR